MSEHSLLKALWSPFRRDISRYIPASLLCTLFFIGGPRTILLLPFGISLLIWSSVVTLRLAPRPTFSWWIERCPQYWLTALFIALLNLLLLLILALLVSSIVGTNALSQPPGSAVLWGAYLSFSLYFCFRTWPLIAAAFLVEGTLFYQNPLYRYWFWRRSPVWLGPGLMKAWQWTSHTKVKGKLSFVVLLSLTGAFLCLFATLPFLDNHPLIRAVLIFFLFLWIVSPVLLFTTAATWMAILYSSESPLVVSSDVIPTSDQELSAVQSKFEDDRFFINRFPNQEQSYWKFILSSSVIDSSREKLLEEIAALGTVRRWHEGSYFEVWSNAADARNDLHPDLILDLQGAVLGVVVLNSDSRAKEALSYLISEWRTRFSVTGPEF